MAVKITSISSSDQDKVLDVGELGAMMVWQNTLSKFCGVYTLEEYERLKTTAVQMAVEGGEVLAHFSNETKPWKPLMPDLEEVDEEVIDLLHFVLTWFNLRGMDPQDVLEHYRAKNLFNYERVSTKLRSLEATRKEA